MLVLILRFCYCSLLYTSGYFGCFRVLGRHKKNISNLVKVLSYCLPMERNIELLWVSRQRSPLNLHETSNLDLIVVKNSTKKWANKLRKKNNAHRLYPMADCYFSSSCYIHQEFPLFCVGRRDVNKMRKSRSLSKAREKLQQSAGSLSDCDTLFYSLPVPLKHSLGRILLSF